MMPEALTCESLRLAPSPVEADARVLAGMIATLTVPAIITLRSVRVWLRWRPAAAHRPGELSSE